MLVAVIGCGSIGTRYIRLLHDLGHDVCACDVDLDAGARARQAGAGRVVADPEELAAYQPEVVIVATPPANHEASAKAAIAWGAAVLVEKPIAHSLDAAERIQQAAAHAAAPVGVVCNMRFHPGVAALYRNRARVGKPLYFRGVFGHRLSQMRARPTQFADSTQAGGGVVLDCIHEFDYLRWMFGNITDVRSHVERLGVSGGDAEDYAVILLSFDTGVRGVLHLDFVRSEKLRGLEITGTDGSLAWTSLGRVPEQIDVCFSDREVRDPVLSDPGYHGHAEYSDMLGAFLSGQGAFQSVDDGIAALRAALQARGGERGFA